MSFKEQVEEQERNIRRMELECDIAKSNSTSSSKSLRYLSSQIHTDVLKPCQDTKLINTILSMNYI